MKFNTYIMEDALEAIIDYRGKTPQKSESGIPTLSAKSVKNNFIDYNNCYYISQEEYNRFMVRGFPKKGDILLTTEAPLGMVAKLDRDDIAIAQRLLTLRGKNNILDNDYLLYFLQSSTGQHLLKSHETGTTVTGIKQAVFRKLEISIPNIEDQRKIATILSALDSRIELNTAINENLESQAQAIFKSWFVDFEPFGGVMPEDWRTGSLSEICGYSKDKVNIEDLTLETYYSTENMQPNRQGAVQATTLPTIKQTTACKKGDVLISNIRPYFKKIIYCFADCGCSTDVLCFVPNKSEYSTFLYCALYSDKFFDYMVAGSKGTKMPRGDKQQIMMYPICIPSTEYVEQFSKIVAPMLEIVYTNRLEANDLAILRDTLLPKLMNGEIDVSEVKI